MKQKFILLVIALAMILSGCTTVSAATPTATRFPTTTPSPSKTSMPSLLEILNIIDTSTPMQATATGTSVPTNTETPVQSVSETPAQNTPEAPTKSTTQSPAIHATLAHNAWKQLPVVPAKISAKMQEVYQRGLAAGRDPNRFSKIGDCQNVDSYFLSIFDDPKEYGLGKYESLKPTIAHYSGSWSRTSLAVKGGMNVASVLTPSWADKTACNKGETPLACEIRNHNPSVIIISMETWWGQKPAEVYNSYMRKIIEAALAENVVPIIATKADNLEGNHEINAVIAQISQDYEIPLWNFWVAVQPLPEHGLTEDGFHLTFARSFFDDPTRMKSAWPWRNLTALQTIDAVLRGLTEK